MKTKNSLMTKLLLTLILSGLVLPTVSCLKQRMNKAYTFYGLGREAFYTNDSVEALKFLDKAIKLRPRDPDFEHLAGLVIFSRGDYDRSGRYLDLAEKYLLRAIKLYDGFEIPYDQDFGRLSQSEAQVNLSAVYLQMERWDDAIEHALIARQDPMYRSPDRANFNIGWAYVQKEMPRKAIPYLKLSVELNREFPGGYKTLGQIYMDLKNYSKAIKYFSQAVKVFPQYTEAMYLMGVAYQKKGQRTTAEKVFKHCYLTEPESEFGKKCEAFIR